MKPESKFSIIWRSIVAMLVLPLGLLICGIITGILNIKGR
jgi:hypothetical protein